MRTSAVKICSAALVALFMLGLLGARPARAASTGPGKKSTFESSDLGDIPAGVSPLLTATIEKGKKKNVLVVEAMLSTGASPSSSYGLPSKPARPRGFTPRARRSDTARPMPGGAACTE